MPSWAIPSWPEPSWGELPGFLLSLLADPNLLRLAAPVFVAIILLSLMARRLAKGETSKQMASEPKSEDESTVEASAELPSELLRRGLTKSRDGFLSRLRAIFEGESKEKRAIRESLEELLISADLGVKTTERLIRAAERALDQGLDKSNTDIIMALKEEIASILATDSPTEIIPSSDRPYVVFIVGVNGVGKTTTVGKLAARFAASGYRVLLGACDTFRAAAHQQLDVWAERAKAEIIAGADGEKPSTVAYRTIERAKDEKFDVVLIDTAGRLHTRVPLMNELKAVHALIARELPGAPHETILVLDATTGQNALQQAKDFHAAVPLSGVVITKLDGSPKGGIVVAIKEEIGIPIRYIGVGERLQDLLPFSAADFVSGLFAAEDPTATPLARVSRKRRLNEAPLSQ